MFCKVRKVQLSLATVLAVVSDVLECREDLEELNKGKFTSIENAGKRWCNFFIRTVSMILSIASAPELQQA